MCKYLHMCPAVCVDVWHLCHCVAQCLSIIHHPMFTFTPPHKHPPTNTPTLTNTHSLAQGSLDSCLPHRPHARQVPAQHPLNVCPVARQPQGEVNYIREGSRHQLHAPLKPRPQLGQGCCCSCCIACWGCGGRVLLLLLLKLVSEAVCTSQQHRHVVLWTLQAARDKNTHTSKIHFTHRSCCARPAITAHNRHVCSLPILPTTST